MLHRISGDRITGTGKTNLRIFASLCGRDVRKNVVVATTMWDAGISEARAQGRLSELKGDLVKEGCVVEIFRKDDESASRILNQILDQQPAGEGKRIS